MSIRNKILVAAFAAGASAFIAGSSFAASPSCTTEPQAKWMPQSQMKQKISDLGYTVTKISVSGSCYELHGKTKDGKRADTLFNPVTGAVVKQKLG